MFWNAIRSNKHKPRSERYFNLCINSWHQCRGLHCSSLEKERPAISWWYCILASFFWKRHHGLTTSLLVLLCTVSSCWAVFKALRDQSRVHARTLCFNQKASRNACKCLSFVFMFCEAKQDGAEWSPSFEPDEQKHIA